MINPGDTIFDVTRPGATRAQLVAFSEGTEDPNPIHVDEAFAKSAGFPSVIQQGPMTTAHFAHLLREKFGDRLETLDITFTAPVFPGDALRLVATVESVGEAIACTLVSTKADGSVAARGVATVRR